MYIYWELFWSFVKVGALCVGGGYASMPLIQAEVIENHAWMTMPQFIDIFTISQMTPGPIGINAATFVGTKVAGLPGAIAATVGFVFPSVFIVLALAKLFFKYRLNELPTLNADVLPYLAGVSLATALGYAAWNIGIIQGNITILVTLSYFSPIFSVVKPS